MQVDIIDSYDAFGDLEANWNDVYLMDPDAQFFMSWTWFSRVFLGNPKQWRVLAVRKGECDHRYVGFFPIRLVTKWSRHHSRFRNELHAAGTWFWGQYTGFICEPSYEDEAIASFAGKLKQLYWSKLSLKYLYASDRRIKLLVAAFPDKLFCSSFHGRWINKGTTNNLICPYIALPDKFETYLRTLLSANTRQKMRRHLRRFDNSQDLYITVTNKDTLHRDLGILVDLWSRRWKESKGGKTKSLAQKYGRILQHGFEANFLYMPILWRHDTPVMALANFVDRLKGGVFFFVSGRDAQERSLCAGLLLHAHAIRWAIENGFNTYDFCHGDEPYKYSFGVTDRQLKHLVVSTQSGKNLNGRLDPTCTDYVKAKIMTFIEHNRFDDAKTGWQQVSDVS